MRRYQSAPCPLPRPLPRPPRRALPHAVPRVWLMTDERVGDELLGMVEALPRGAGIIFRHHKTPPAERRALFTAIAAIARRRHLVVVRAGKDAMPREQGIHGAGRSRRPRFRTWAAHSRREALAGARAGADLMFVSPIFDTRSHPGARSLGPKRAAMIARGLNIPTIALGGMNACRLRRLVALGFVGWAAIDAWRPDRRQKRNAVPT